MFLNYMRMKILLPGLLLVISIVAYGQSGEKNFIDQNYIEVIGKAEQEIVPDIIYIKISISEKDTKNKVSISDTEKLMLDKLQAMGIDLSKDLSIKDLGSNFRFYFLSKTEIILSKEYQLIVHDGKTAGRVFVELEKIGISNASIDHVDHSKIDLFKRDVKIQAIQAAKSKSEYLAQAVNQSIGRALYIQELEISPINRMIANSVNFGAVHRGMSDYTEAPIEFEKIKLEASVLTRFELK